MEGMGEGRECSVSHAEQQVFTCMAGMERMACCCKTASNVENGCDSEICAQRIAGCSLEMACGSSGNEGCYDEVASFNGTPLEAHADSCDQGMEEVASPYHR